MTLTIPASIDAGMYTMPTGYIPPLWARALAARTTSATTRAESALTMLEASNLIAENQGLRASIATRRFEAVPVVDRESDE